MAPILRVILTSTVLLGLGWASQLRAEEQKLVWPEIVSLSLTIDGKPSDVVTHIYKPNAQGSMTFPVVIFAHGNRIPPTDLQYPITVGVANWWLQRGFAVIAPVRLGYGKTGGDFREIQNVTWQGSSCTSEPTYQSATVKGSEVVLSALKWAQGQPWAKRDRVLLVGFSAGWLGTLAVAANNPEGVVAAINFSGGMGGNPRLSPRQSCRPELLTDIYRQYGTTTRIPTLWLYAENDLFWGADVPKNWFAAFKMGGSDATFFQTAPVGANGHFLIDEGGPPWEPTVAAFLQKLKM